MARYLIAVHDGWREEAGEVELIGCWAQVALTDEFMAQVDTSSYQVFLSSYDAALVYVQNRLPRSFEIHAVPAQHGKRSMSMRCSYRVVARCLPRVMPEGGRSADRNGDTGPMHE